MEERKLEGLVYHACRLKAAYNHYIEGGKYKVPLVSDTPLGSVEIRLRYGSEG